MRVGMVLVTVQMGVFLSVSDQTGTVLLLAIETNFAS